MSSYPSRPHTSRRRTPVATVLSYPVTDLESLHTFQAVVRLGGISAASRELRLAKSTVSKHVARLEAGIGTRLLLRQSRTVVPTPAGALVMSRSHRLLALLEELRRCAVALAPSDAEALAPRRSEGVSSRQVFSHSDGAEPPDRRPRPPRREAIPDAAGRVE